MKCELVYASSFEEFFYEENDMSVSEGNPVGVDIDMGDHVELVLFEDIYWDLPNEKE